MESCSRRPERHSHTDLSRIGFGLSALWDRHPQPHATWQAARLCAPVVFLIGMLLLSLTALGSFAVDLNMAVALLVLANFGAGCWIAMYLTVAQEVSATNVPTAAGLSGGSGSLAGALAMWAVGKVTHEASSLALPLVCIALAALLASVAGSHVVRHKEESQEFLRA